MRICREISAPPTTLILNSNSNTKCCKRIPASIEADGQFVLNVIFHFHSPSQNDRGTNSELEERAKPVLLSPNVPSSSTPKTLSVYLLLLIWM